MGRSTNFTGQPIEQTGLKRLYIMYATTITLFKEILKGMGRNSKEGKKERGDQSTYCY